MLIIDNLFYIFSTILVVSSLFVVFTSNPVHSVLFLIFSFFNAAAIFVLLGAEFLAMLLVIVYVGAVAVLFLFVVMMLDINFANSKRNLVKHLPIALVLSAILLIELFYVIDLSSNKEIIRITGQLPIDVSVSNVSAIGEVLYTDFIYAFQLSGIILLLAMVGAIVLTLRQRVGVKKQNISAQNARTREESVQLVKVKSGQGVE